MQEPMQVERAIINGLVCWRAGDVALPIIAGGAPNGEGGGGQSQEDHDLRTELPEIRFHDLRHTAATLLLGQGVHPKMVSMMLGHASIAITLDLYRHVTPTMHRDAVAAMERVLHG